MHDASALAVFLSALIVGVSIAAPVGPIGLLVVQRTLHAGIAIGLATGLGAAAADALYGALGAYGVTWLVSMLAAVRVPLALIGGAFLLWLAWRTWRTPVATHAARVAGRGGLFKAFAGTFVLTLSNPATILSFIAVFGTLAAAGRPASPGPMIAGVLAGSALWWLLLCSAVALLRKRFDMRAQRVVNRVSALVLAGFAAWQWAGLALT